MLTAPAGLRRFSLLLLLVLAVSGLAFFAAACDITGGGDGDSPSSNLEPLPTPTPRPRVAQTPTPTEVSPPDGDEDGVPDEQDACPQEFDDGHWTDPDNPDGCPDTLEDLLVLARDDVNGFWQKVFDNEGVDYEPPADFIGYGDAGGQSACGSLDPDNAFYCPADHTIYLHMPFMQSLLNNVGDFGAAFVVAHEWGHLVQADLGILQDTSLYSIQIELQADCFAGVYTADAENRGILEEGDREEAIASLFSAGDPYDTPFDHPQGHGTSEERIDWFTRGYEEGIPTCMSLLSPDTPIS